VSLVLWMCFLRLLSKIRNQIGVSQVRNMRIVHSSGVFMLQWVRVALQSLVTLAHAMCLIRIMSFLFVMIGSMRPKAKKACAKGVCGGDTTPAGPKKKRSASNSAGGAAKRQR